MIRPFSVATWLLLTLAAAGVRAQSITGPSTAAVAQMIPLGVTGADPNAQFLWVCGQSSGTILDFNSQAVFQGMQAGNYDILLVAVTCGAGNKPSGVKLHHTITVGGSPNPPGPNPPVPPPPIVPVFPASKFNLAKDVYGWGVAVDPSGKALASRLATNFETVAAQIAAGTIKTGAAAITQTNTINKATEGANVNAWVPFFAALATRVNALQPQLGAMSDVQEAWLEIAAGLRAVQ